VRAYGVRTQALHCHNGQGRGLSSRSPIVSPVSSVAPGGLAGNLRCAAPGTPLPAQ